MYVLQDIETVSESPETSDDEFCCSTFELLKADKIILDVSDVDISDIKLNSTYLKRQNLQLN